MKNILITGSTDGIGKLTAIKLAKNGHRIFLHGRNPEKLERVIEEVQTLAGNGDVGGFVADLSDFAAINSMIVEVKSTLEQIDVLINNAGVLKSLHSVNNQDVEMRFMVNYFAPYVLTKGLISLLKKSDSPRIINLSSAAQSTVDLQAFTGNKIGAQEAYAQSKLALTMWTMDFANREKEILAIAVNPGSLLNTKMVQEAYGRHWSSADKGRDVLYELATSPKYQNDSGKYFDNDKGDSIGMFSKAHADAYNTSKIQALMSETENMLNSFI